MGRLVEKRNAYLLAQASRSRLRTTDRLPGFPCGFGFADSWYERLPSRPGREASTRTGPRPKGLAADQTPLSGDGEVTRSSGESSGNVTLMCLGRPRGITGGAQASETVVVHDRPVAIRGQVDRSDPFASSQTHSTAAAG